MCIRDSLRPAEDALVPWTIATPVGWEFGAAPLWAQALSRDLDGVTVALLQWGSHWSFSAFAAGHEVFGCEGLFFAEPQTYGDASRASQLLEVSEVTLARSATAPLGSLIEALGMRSIPLT